MDPPPIIKFLELCACSVRIKGPTPSNGVCAAIATHNNDTVQYERHRTSIGFKLAVALEQVAF